MGTTPKTVSIPQQTNQFDLPTNESDLIDMESPDPNAAGTLGRNTSASKTSFTTANGDGLTFDPFSLNLFDEIQLIIERKPLPVVAEVVVEDEEPLIEVKEEPSPEFFMYDVPDSMKPTSILLEVIEQIETLKENLQPMRDRESDLLNCIKQLKRGGDADKIYSCSFTLETLVTLLKTSLDHENELKDKSSKQSKSIFHLKQQLADVRSKNELLEATNITLRQELNTVHVDREVLQRRSEYLIRQLDEIRAMHNSD